MQLDEREFDVAVVGGGASGTLLAAHFKRAGAFSQSLALIEASGRPCRGVAYGTTQPAHLLNVAASNMSAFQSQPGHFVAWLAGVMDGAEPASYAPRVLYGEYLHDMLNEYAESAPEIVHVSGAATRLARQDGRWIVHLDGERRMISRAVVFALGNLPPADPIDFAEGAPAGYVSDPWSAPLMNDLPLDAPLLLIGSGLTMVDVVLELRAGGHRGPLHVISRHGRIHRPQRPFWPRPQCALPKAGSSPLECLRWLRAEMESAKREGYDWRAVITSIRSCTASIWSHWSIAQKGSFLRHARSLWDMHRHRLAPEVHTEIDALLRQGTMQVHAGRILSITENSEALLVQWRPRGRAETQTLHAARVINCTGPVTDYARVQQPLVAQLRGVGWLTPDPLGLGIETEDDGGLIDRNGRRVPGLFAIGPMCRPRLWESTAIPEIRVQAAALAKQFSINASTTRQRERVAI
jgi:uncharacterized NAD(P)/FAD-binding protein YdhS